MNLEGILNQIFQPYFYYSLISLVVSFACIKGLTRFFNFMRMSRTAKSLLYFVPLILPIIVMLVFVPSIIIRTTSNQLTAFTVYSCGQVSAFPFVQFGIPLPPQSNLFIALVPTTTTILSITGILCLTGLILGTIFAISIIVADDRIARKVLHIIPLRAAEHEWLRSKISDNAKKLGIAAPKIGVVEDLRPNAFTVGYGKRAMIIFSIGLFNVLNDEELIAVAFHELAHIKNHDFFFKTMSSALTVVSFFNPLSYLVSSLIQREREMLADEGAINLLSKPASLGDALAKICKAIQDLPKENMLNSFSSNLLVSSSLLHRVGIFSTHPRLDTRLRNISEPKLSFNLDRRKVLSTFFFSVLLVSIIIVVSGAMINVQVNYTSSNLQSSGFNLLSYESAKNNGVVLSSIYALPYNTSPNKGMPTVNFPTNVHFVSTQLVRNISLNGQQIPVTFLDVNPQNASFISIQPPLMLHDEFWKG